jgi:mannosylglycerate hydrolase MGH1-like protein
MAAFRAALLASAVVMLAGGVRADPASPKAYERPEYNGIRERLLHGWGTWDSGDALAQVLLPDGLSVSLSFVATDGSGAFAKPHLVTDKKGSDFRAGMHALDGSYSEADIDWKGIRMRVQTATQGDDLVILVTPLGAKSLPIETVAAVSILWGRPGVVSRGANSVVAAMPDRKIPIFTTGVEGGKTQAAAGAPSLGGLLTGTVGFSTGKPRTVAEIQEIVRVRRDALSREAAAHGNLAEAYEAIRAAIGWSTIYDSGHDRLITVVSREWNAWFGGYVVFGWDNFFIPYACSLFCRELALANYAEHMRSLTPGGFIPNVEKTGGKTSWDRSQPPVGSIMLKEIYKKYGDRWLLEASFDDLLAWNRWWIANRKNGKLLAWGTNVADGPLHEKEAHTHQGAAWESGMDDSPMFDGVPFNPQKSMLEMQDVGLNSLYVADCRALAEIADVIDRKIEAAELRLRAEQIGREMETLWNPASGMYENRRTDTGKFSGRLSPTVFFPLVAGIPTLDRATEMVDQHLMNPLEFGGKFVLPSISRNDPAFPTQHYWKGAVWPPLNFMVYLGLRNYPFPRARQELADKSMAMFLGEWRRKGFISENYSALDGTGDDPHLTSTPFYTWGVLMGMMEFIEAGQMPAPEAPLTALPGRKA